ncbi:hypothetical protein GQ55_3G157200 [Panicum hallii var. hallii]|uniref:Uncharacterized protein n=1 Tax=Panicum hallii var. hallii TaxID=1504633 RepID=A0A2T7E9W7_9POAL|nr:hypothetical protein GQ55_3G157200 [Panicum hallii var. hallii]
MIDPTTAKTKPRRGSLSVGTVKKPPSPSPRAPHSPTPARRPRAPAAAGIRQEATSADAVPPIHSAFPSSPPLPSPPLPFLRPQRNSQQPTRRSRTSPAPRPHGAPPRLAAVFFSGKHRPEHHDSRVKDLPAPLRSPPTPRPPAPVLPSSPAFSSSPKPKPLARAGKVEREAAVEP